MKCKHVLLAVEDGLMAVGIMATMTEVGLLVGKLRMFLAVCI